MRTGQKPKLIVIVGPTSSGKTTLAIRLAKKFKGEIISADSRQVYRGMDIGTDKPRTRASTAQGRLKGTLLVKGIPHHLIDVVGPDEEFTLGHWLELTKKTISEIERRNHIPIITGGTGLYISALLYGFNVPEVPPNNKLRKKLELEMEKYGTEQLAKKILKKDPEAAAFLDTKNPRRLIRAWEVMESTGKKFSQTRKRSARSQYNALIIGLKMPTNKLEKKISSRLKNQFKKGLKKEITALSKKYSWTLSSMNTLGYSQWRGHSHDNSISRLPAGTIVDKPLRKTPSGKLAPKQFGAQTVPRSVLRNGSTSVSSDVAQYKLSRSLKDKDVFEKILKDTIRYSKRQMTWFKRMNEIFWLEADNKKRLENQAAKYIRIFLRHQNSK